MKTRRHYKTFKPRFAGLVVVGIKTSTIRPSPRRLQDVPRPGDILCARAWEGRPYRSKQRILGEWTITEVRIATVTMAGVRVLEGAYSKALDRDGVSGREGFSDWVEMRNWFEAEHGLPFTGILIEWKATR